jgi:LmbE family N-acetylglucosaminyl deacetylase
MNATAIVAHPDDEIIWCGGLILRHRDWAWTVLSLCRADDADRAPKFRRACEHVGATGFISDLDDGTPLAEIDPSRDLMPRIEERLGRAEWDLCLTHGQNGEYGHRRHVQVHQAVHSLVTSNRLCARRLWTFAYVAVNPTGNCRPAPWADRRLELTPDELAEKRRIVRDLYGYPDDGFEVRACISPEAYTCAGGAEEELAL